MTKTQKLTSKFPCQDFNVVYWVHVSNGNDVLDLNTVNSLKSNLLGYAFLTKIMKLGYFFVVLYSANVVDAWKEILLVHTWEPV